VSSLLNFSYALLSVDLDRVLYFLLFFSDDEDPKKFSATAPATDAPIFDEPLSQEAAVLPKSPEAAAKKAGSRASKRLKKTSASSTSFDAPRPVTPTDDVSTIYVCCLLALNCSSHTLPSTDFAEKVHLFG
jgi:hypothetical protein